MQQKFRVILSAVMVAVLTACGGGGGDSASSGASATSGDQSAPVTTAPQADALSISGTAATGLAIANAPVEARCATGTGTATTAADGTFSMVLPAQSQAPCVLRVALPDSTFLHSLVPASVVGPKVANITPLSEFVVAAASGQNPAALFADFQASFQAMLNQQAITDAIKKVADALAGVIALGGVDPLTSQLTAATSAGGAGNAFDQALDELMAQLSARQVALADLAAAMATSPGTNAPAKTLLQPPASSCAPLRSGTYNVMDAAVKVTVDAPALTIAATDGTDKLTLVPGSEACTFTAADAPFPVTFVVSNTGVILMRTAPPQQMAHLSLLVPVQDLPKSELAGTWNLLGYELGAGNAGDDRYGQSAVKLQFNEAGDFVGGAECAGETCEAWPAEDVLTVNRTDEGSFELVDSEGVARAQLFKNANGQTAMFVASTQGMLLGAKEQAEAMPAVGAVTNSWDITLDPTGNAAVFGANTATIATVDASSMTYTRTARMSGGTDQPDDQWTLNAPRTGLRHRAATTVLSEVTSLNVRGAGFNVAHLTQLNGMQTLLLSTAKVTQP